MTCDQATEVGLSKREIDGLVARGEWRREHRGVLVDNAAPVTPMQAVVAASLAIGLRGLASHRLAAWLWRLIEGEPVLEFSALRAIRLPGIKVYRVAAMPRASRVGIVAVTTPMRALLNVAAVAPELAQEAFLNGVLHRKLFTPKTVEAELQRARTKGKRGVTMLESVLHDLGIGRFTPSQLEVRARRLFAAIGLPQPEIEVVFGRFGEYRLDFFWPEAGLVVEVDGWSIHAAPGARRNDFTKQNRIVMSDKWLLRYDWFQIVHDAANTSSELLEAYRLRTSLLV